MRISAPNYTQTPNEFFDYWAPKLKEGEFRLFAALIRKTFGWHKKYDRISLSQLAEMTGMERSRVCKSLKGLIEKKIVEKKKFGKIGRERCYYSLIIEHIEDEKLKDDDGIESEEEMLLFSNISDQCPKDTGGSVPKTLDQCPKDTHKRNYPKETIKKNHHHHSPLPKESIQTIDLKENGGDGGILSNPKKEKNYEREKKNSVQGQKNSVQETKSSSKKEEKPTSEKNKSAEKTPEYRPHHQIKLESYDEAVEWLYAIGLKRFDIERLCTEENWQNVKIARYEMSRAKNISNPIGWVYKKLLKLSNLDKL